MGRFLITGALGAVGVWTMRSLLEHGHDVVAFDVGGDGHRLPIALEPDQIEAVVRVQGDITDLQAVERAIDEHAITNVIHLAALQVPFVRADPALGTRVNVVGTVNVLEAVRRRKDRIGHVVYASSIAVYGAGGTLDAADVPGTLYGVTKRANEGAALRYSEDYGVSSIGLRPHTVYGPARDQGMTSAPTVAMLATAAGVPFRIPFGGSVQLQYAPDVGEAFARTAELEYDGASVHNVDGPVVAISDLVGLLGEGITADDQALPFPGGVDGSSFVALLGGSVMRSVQDGVIDAVQRFERLLAAGLVKPP
ncbi:MAG TPA: NAD(P)-dependent oxidoreductase [Solirubrobacteraceae bacterium]|jgi:nucleoside-diphosphate-sugar epimerase